MLNRGRGLRVFTSAMRKAKEKREARKAKQAEKIARAGPPHTPQRHTVLDSWTRHRPKSWGRIRPTLAGQNGLRYEIAEVMDTHYFCYVTAPSEEMELVGCDRCVGPHRPENKGCRGTTHRNARRAFTLTRPLYLLQTGDIMAEDLEIGIIEWNTPAARAGRVLVRRLPANLPLA